MSTKQSMARARTGKVSSRCCLERMTKAWAQIKNAKGNVTSTTLAAEFECSAKTIQRDLEFLRDRIGLPITFHPQKGGGTWKVDPTAKLPWWTQC